MYRNVGSPKNRSFEIRIHQAARRGRESERITNFKTDTNAENKIHRSTNSKGAQAT